MLGEGISEGMKALGPFPILQFLLGLAVLGGGAYMIVRGITGKREPMLSLEDKRAEWAAYEQLRNLEENSFKQVELLKQTCEMIKKLDESTKALASAIWNRGV